MFKKLEPFFDIMGEILAVLLVCIFIVSLADAQWDFLSGVPWLYNTIAIIRTYGTILLIAVVGLEAMCKRNIVFFIIFCVMLAVIIIFMFFPDTYDNLIHLIKK